MTQKIYKYILDGNALQMITIPGFKKVLSIKKQHNRVVLYALVDTDVHAAKDVWIKSAWTGEELIDDIDQFEYLDTIVLDTIDYVVHYFVKVNWNVTRKNP